MEVRPLEIVDARNLGKLGLDERPSSGYDDIGREFELGAGDSVLNVDSVSLRLVVPLRADEFVVEQERIAKFSRVSTTGTHLTHQWSTEGCLTVLID